MQYDAPGLGVGEVWLDERRTCLPQRAAAATASEPAQSRLRRGSDVWPAGCRRSSRATPDDFADVRARAARRLLRRLRPRAADGPARRGRHLRRARSARRAAAARRARPGRSAPAATWRRSCPCTASSRPAGIGSWGDLGVDYKRRLLELEDVAL